MRWLRVVFIVVSSTQPALAQHFERPERFAAPRDYAPSRNEAPERVDREPPSAPSEPLRAHHATYLEIGGASHLGSFNYEWRPVVPISVRAGVGYHRFCSDTCKDYFPLVTQLSLLPSVGDHALEIGAGVTTGLLHGVVGVFWPYGALGYRYHPRAVGPLFRLTYTPVVENHGGIFHWFGFSVGWTA